MKKSLIEELPKIVAEGRKQCKSETGRFVGKSGKASCALFAISG